MMLLAWFVTPASADFDGGMAAYQREDYATAFREFKSLAEKGAAEAEVEEALSVTSCNVWCARQGSNLRQPA